MKDINERELVAVDGGGVCVSIFSNYPSWVNDGDWCFGIRIN